MTDQAYGISVGTGVRAVRGAATGAAPSAAGPDLLTVGRRIRHLRQKHDRTLDDVAGAAGISASALSLIENGKREAKLSVLTAVATALGTDLGDLLSVAPPSRRAAMEIELEKAQRADSFSALHIPAVRPGPAVAD